MNPDHAGQIRDAEELLSAGTHRPGLAKSLYLGHFVPDFVMTFTTPLEARPNSAMPPVVIT